MLPFKQSQLALLADKLSDVANLAAGAMVFGQFLSGRPFSLPLALFGLGIWLIVMTCAAVMAGRRRT